MIVYLTMALASFAQAEECTTPITSQTLDTQLDSVAMGFVEFEVEKIQKGLGFIQQNIPCLSESIESEVAHDYHMLNGLYLYLMQETEPAENALRLAKRLAPDKGIPTHLFDPNHALHELYADLEYIELDSEIPTSPKGVYVFNGQTINRPVGTQSIVQIKEGSTIILSAIVDADAALPLPNTQAPSVVQSDSQAPVVEAKTAAVVTPTTDSQTVEQTSPSSDFPWVWTGGAALSTVGYAVTYNQFCGGFDSLNCQSPQADNHTLQYVNYAFLGLGAVSAYKIATNKKD